MARRAESRSLRLTPIAVLLVCACALALWPCYGLLIATPPLLPLASVRVDLPAQLNEAFGKDWPRTPQMIELERRRLVFSGAMHWPEKQEYVATMGEQSWPGVRMSQYHVRPGSNVGPMPQTLVVTTGLGNPILVEIGWPMPMFYKVIDARFTPKVRWLWSAKGLAVNLATAMALVGMPWVAMRLAKYRRRIQQGRCKGCGYVLIAKQGVCPECGLLGQVSRAPA